MKPNFKILIVEDSESLRDSLQSLLGVYNDVDTAHNIASARDALASTGYDVVVLDKGLPDGDGLTLIPEIKGDHPSIVVIVLTGDKDHASIRRALNAGADDYVVKAEHVVADLLVRIPFAVERASGKRDLQTLKEQLWGAFKYEILGRSASTEQLRATLLSHRDSNAHVLITGESGTGKELIARRLHALADNGARPFVAQNCAALPDSLIESELFGHMKGSFSGAIANKPGKFELAHKGDLFLDELGDLSLQAQAKLLRVLDDGQFFRVGGVQPIHSSCRVIAATNKNLEDMIRKGTFREDLYHRLAVVPIQTTPLRRRPEDVPDIARVICCQIGGPGMSFSDGAIASLKLHDWPGNGRELRNTVERAILRAKRRGTTTIESEDILLDAFRGQGSELRRLEGLVPRVATDLTNEKYEEFMRVAEREFFIAALDATGGDVPDLASRIDLARSTVFKKFTALNIPRRKYASRSEGYTSSQRSVNDMRLGL